MELRVKGQDLTYLLQKEILGCVENLIMGSCRGANRVVKYYRWHDKLSNEVSNREWRTGSSFFIFNKVISTSK